MRSLALTEASRLFSPEAAFDDAISSMPIAVPKRSLRRDLSMAVRHNNFLLDYQPRLSLRTGQPVGGEALLRWPHHRSGSIAPHVFIPLAEQTGDIIRIGGWMLRKACEEAASWPGDLVISVNVSPRQLRDPGFLRQVAVALEASRLPPEMLEMELTESLLVNVGTETLLTLSAVRDLGVGLALNEFGTGCATLAMLKRLPLTMMKIGRTLVRDLPGDCEDAAIVRAIVATGRAFGLAVCADGIETEAQRAFLGECGCNQGQGALFSQALPPELFRQRMLTLANA